MKPNIRTLVNGGLAVLVKRSSHQDAGLCIRFTVTNGSSSLQIDIVRTRYRTVSKTGKVSVKRVFKAVTKRREFVAGKTIVFNGTINSKNTLAALLSELEPYTLFTTQDYA